MSKTIKEIKAILSNLTEISDLTEFSSDERSGVKNAVKQREKQILAAQAEDERLENLLSFERELYVQNIQFIAGIDEVGRGPLAGPVVAAAVILPQNCKISRLNDSKKIPKKYHQEVFDEITEKALAIGIGIVDNVKIDQINIYQATKIAMLDAVSNLRLDLRTRSLSESGQSSEARMTEKPQHLLIDAMKLEIDIPQTSIIKGDAKSASIAAASIIAKVTRDKMMADFAVKYPEYDFENNAGYGTKKHLEALKNHGITDIHRKSYEPIKSMIN